MAQTAICLERVKKELLNPLILLKLILNIRIQTELLVSIRLIRQIMEHVALLHTRIIQILMDKFSNISGLLQIRDR